MRKILYTIGLAALMSSAALAGSASNTFTSNATVASVCLIQSATLNFNTVATVALSAATQSTTTISVACTNGMPAPNITMTKGTNGTGTDAAPVRHLKNTVTTDLLTYHLYSDSGYSTEWTNTNVLFPTTPDGTYQTMTVYGQVDGAQHSVPAGSYTDAVTVSVVF